MKKSKNRQPKIRREWSRKPQTQITPDRKKDFEDCPYCDGTGYLYGFYDLTADIVCDECGGTGLK
jgi:hypothetical protein